MILFNALCFEFLISPLWISLLMPSPSLFRMLDYLYLCRRLVSLIIHHLGRGC
ncbi:hypothetical protein ACS0TY_011228 [Phlomoides rotata]